MIIVLHEQGPKRIRNGIGRVAVTLRIGLHVGNVIEIGAALADGQSRCAGVVSEDAQVTGSAEFLTITAGVSHYRVGAELDLMRTPGSGQNVVALILPVEQQGGLRSAAGESAAGGDGRAS